jgi:phosphoserine phosphatase
MFKTVVFDCDSTLSSIEGIEELASDHRAEVTQLTEAAMRGELPLEQVYGRRLAVVRPTRAQVRALGELYVATLVPDATEVVRELQRAGVEVRILSGGLRPAVLAMAHALGVDERHVAAVDVFFDAAGAYAGFDEGSPLARAGGKRDVLASAPDLQRPVMLVGDGATDLEAQPAVDLFVAYCGVATRAGVVDQAGYVVRSLSLAPVYNLALFGHRPSEPEARTLWERGASLLRDTSDGRAAR